MVLNYKTRGKKEEEWAQNTRTNLSFLFVHSTCKSGVFSFWVSIAGCLNDRRGRLLFEEKTDLFAQLEMMASNELPELLFLVFNDLYPVLVNRSFPILSQSLLHTN